MPPPACRLLFFVFILSLGWPRVVPAQVPEVLINLDERRQVIEHFGANDAWYFQKIGAWSESSKNRVADLLYSTERGIGLTFCRFYLGAGINRKTIADRWRTADTFEVAEGQYDWNRLEAERWFLRAAKARGVTQFGLTVYSPPARLTRNGLTNHGADKSSSTNLRPGGEASFVRYLTDVLLHFRHHPDPVSRIEFARIFPVNEPQWDWQSGQEGCRASNADLRQLFIPLDHSLREAGLSTRIAGPESGSIQNMRKPSDNAAVKWKASYGDYLNFFTGDPELARCMDGLLTYHSYWSDRVPGDLFPEREAMGQVMSGHPEWRLWQSEYCIMEGGRDLGMDSALRMARVIHADLVLARVTSWQWWLAVAGENYKSGLIYTDYRNPGDAESILESKMLWTLGNYSRFVRPGMRRVEVSGVGKDPLGLLVSAFLDEKTGRLVLICVNQAAGDAKIRLALAGRTRNPRGPLPMVPHTTSAEKNLVRGLTSDARQGLTIPARSVVTWVHHP